MTYLYHLTINTGHARKSYRSEISLDAIRVCSELLAQIAEQPGMRFGMPGPPSYEIAGRISGQCMSASVFAAHSESPLIRMAIAGRERCGAALWQALCGDRAQPDAPWLAVFLEPALALDFAASGWLGDFERCLAWAFLEMSQ